PRDRGEPDRRGRAAPAAGGEGRAMSVEVRVPPLGESVNDGVISRWLKRDGDVVKTDEPLFELETDKATMEIPATAGGRLEIVAAEGTTVQVGAVVARIAEVAGDVAAPVAAEAPARAAAPASMPAAGPARPTATSGPAEPSRPTFSEEDG